MVVQIVSKELSAQRWLIPISLPCWAIIVLQSKRSTALFSKPKHTKLTASFPFSSLILLLLRIWTYMENCLKVKPNVQSSPFGFEKIWKWSHSNVILSFCFNLRGLVNIMHWPFRNYRQLGGLSNKVKSGLLDLWCYQWIASRNKFSVYIHESVYWLETLAMILSPLWECSCNHPFWLSFMVFQAFWQGSHVCLAWDWSDLKNQQQEILCSDWPIGL